MPYPTTPKTWVAGDVLTAAQLNAELRDALLGAFPLGPPDVAWTGYTPTLTQSVVVAKTVTYAKYMKLGRTIFVNVVLAVSGAGTAGQQVKVGLPVAASIASQNLPIGSFMVVDASATTNYTGICELASATECYGIVSGQANVMGVSSFAAALAAGDAVGFHAVYEAAT